MIRLHPEQLNGKLQFMRDYISAQNAAGFGCIPNS